MQWTALHAATDADRPDKSSFKEVSSDTNWFAASLQLLRHS